MNDAVTSATTSIAEQVEPSRLDDFSPRYRAMLVTLLCIAGLFNFTDRNLFPILAQAIKHDLRLSDLELGLLGGPSFAFVYALAGLPVARLADRKNRVRIIALTTVVWSIFCIGCGVAQSFVQMLLARAGVGIGEAGFFPATTSLVGDHFPDRRRASILSLIQLGSPASTIFCAIVAATIGTIWGWRAALVAVGLPGIVVGGAIMWLLREPNRGTYDAEPAVSRNWLASIADLLRKPTLVRVTVAAALVTFCVNAIAVFYVAYFVRIHGWTLAQGGYAFGVIQCAAATVGLTFGGFGVDWLARRDERWRCWLPALGVTVACISYIAAFRHDDALITAGLLLFGGIFLFTFYTPSIALVQGMAEPGSRATAVAIFLLAGTVVGVGLGPVAAGFASDVFAGRYFGGHEFARLCPGGEAPPGSAAELAARCKAASAAGLKAALTVSPLPLLISAAGYLYASASLRDDLRRIARR